MRDLADGRIAMVDGERFDHERMHASAVAAVGEAIAMLRQRGQRVTGPRRAVLAALAGRPEHLTADEVAALIPRDRVHRATVYRTLDLLADAGVVLQRNAPGGATRYHLASAGPGREHLHGHCHHCGSVAVLRLPTDVTVALAEAGDASDFVLDLRRSTLVGVCRACARRGAASARV